MGEKFVEGNFGDEKCSLFDVLDDGGPGWKGFEREDGL